MRVISAVSSSRSQMSRDDLPVPAEEHEQDQAQDGQEQEHEQPGERPRRLAVVHDEQHGDDHPVGKERHAEPPGQWQPDIRGADKAQAGEVHHLPSVTLSGLYR
jgi:hypothetical protein